MRMKKWLFLSMSAVFFSFVSGCFQGEEHVEATETGELPAKQVVSEAPLPEAVAPVSTEPPPAEEEDKNSISVASPQTETIRPELPENLVKSEPGQSIGEPKEATGGQQPSPNTPADSTAFHPEHPTLLGISIGTGVEQLEARFGKPTETYLLPDDSVDAHVWKYSGFALGVSGGKVLFVEVDSPSVDPDLNGLKLGDTYDDAVAKLGKPNLETNYVIGYAANSVVLKLDLDPETKVIQSVKLFPEE